VEGNGRTGRILLNLMLMQRGFLPVTIQNDERNAYMRALNSADHGNLDPLETLLLKCEERTLDFYLEALTPNYKPPKYQKLSELAKYFSFFPDYIRLLIRQGKIHGKKVGKTWFTTKKAIQSYIDSVKKKGTSKQQD